MNPSADRIRNQPIWQHLMALDPWIAMISTRVRSDAESLKANIDDLAAQITGPLPGDAHCLGPRPSRVP
jgi:hypothetical protein